MTRAGQASSKQVVVAALESRPDVTAVAVARATGLGRSTVSKVLARLESEARVRRTRGERACGRRQPDRWALVTASASGTRLRRGQLDRVVFDYLSKRTEPLTAASVAKATGRSSGAVANCLARLEAAGRVRQLTNRPRRYVAAVNSRRDRAG